MGKSGIRRQNNRTIYTVYNFLKDISEQYEGFSKNMCPQNIRHTVTANGCDVHHKYLAEDL